MMYLFQYNLSISKAISERSYGNEISLIMKYAAYYMHIICLLYAAYYMLIKLNFDKTIILSPRQQPKSFKDIKCWNIQKENEFRKDSAWVIQWAVWRQNQIVGPQIWTDDQANTKKETQEGFPIQFLTIQNQNKGCLYNFDSDSKYSVRTVSYNVRSGRSFRHTRQSFSSKLAVGGLTFSFLILERSLLGVRVIKISQTIHLRG